MQYVGMLPNHAYKPNAPEASALTAMPGLVLLEFGTDWCGHCQAAQPVIIEALGEVEASAGCAISTHLKIEDGKGRTLGRGFAIKRWPTLVLLRDGDELARVVRPRTTDDVLALFKCLT